MVTPLVESVMWVQREKLFSQWKERVVVMTEEELHCYKKGSAQLSAVGSLILKVLILLVTKIMISLLQVCLQDILSVSLVDRRGYLTVVMLIDNEDSIVVRRPENLRDWYNKVQRMVQDSKTREMQSTEEFWTKKFETYSQSLYTEGVQRPSSTVSLDRRRRREKTRRE